MNFRIIVAFLISCTMLCSCKGAESPLAESTVVAVTDSANEKNDTEKTSVSTQTAAANDSTDTADETSAQSVGEINFSGNTDADASETAALPTETSENKASLESGNNMQDDGFNWSSLAPV